MSNDRTPNPFLFKERLIAATQKLHEAQVEVTNLLNLVTRYHAGLVLPSISEKKEGQPQ